jgi:hypothetical protein
MDAPGLMVGVANVHVRLIGISQFILHEPQYRSLGGLNARKKVNKVNSEMRTENQPGRSLEQPPGGPPRCLFHKKSKSPTVIRRY